MEANKRKSRQSKGPAEITLGPEVVFKKWGQELCADIDKKTESLKKQHDGLLQHLCQTTCFLTKFRAGLRSWMAEASDKEKQDRMEATQAVLSSLREEDYAQVTDILCALAPGDKNNVRHVYEKVLANNFAEDENLKKYHKNVDSVQSKTIVLRECVKKIGQKLDF